jgi:2'-5' RNA ligase
VRLFIAVDVDAATRRAVERLRERVRERLPAADRALRWVEPANLHLTIRFLGEQADPGRIEAALGPPFEQPAFDLAWHDPAWLPPRGRPRVFYLAVGDGVAPLQALEREITHRLAGLGVPPDERPFTAHLTLARVREGADPHVIGRLDAATAHEPVAAGLRVPVGTVVLYESRLSPRGSTYIARHRSALRRDPSALRRDPP